MQTIAQRQRNPPPARAEQAEAAWWACDLRDGRGLAPGLYNDARNVRCPEGRPETRKGVIKPGWANKITAGSDIINPLGTAYGAGVFRDPGGTVDWQIIAADGYAWRTRSYNQNVTIPLPTGVRLLSRCTFVQAFNKLFCFRGRYLAPLRMTSFDDGFEDLLDHWSSSATHAAGTEVFYGPFQEVSTPVLLSAGELTSASTTATVTHAAHGLDTGDSITIYGATQPEYNGTYTITVTGVNTFTYTFAGSGTTPATGTIYYVKSGLTRSGNTATVVTVQPHGYVTGADITISGANASEYNGRFNITVVDDYTFTYFVAGAPATPDVGTVKCSNMSYAYESLGTLYTLTSITRSGTTATATKAAHGFSNGHTVTIAGATPSGYNGTYVISNVTANTFDYTMAADPGSSASPAGTVRNSLTLAGQSPDTTATSWQRVYDILPNADTALYTNNRLLVPTAYTPGTTGYNSAAVTYTKVDFIVATDIQDEIHIDFTNEFRINQGSSDEIVDLAKWSQDVVIVWKGKSWGVLTGVALDLTDLAFDLRSKSYGLSARAAWAEAGDNIVFVADKRGFVNIRQSESGKLIGVDVPMSAPIQKLIDRIDWTQADTIKLANWNSHLYAHVPIPSEDDYCVLVFSFVSAAMLGGNSVNGQQGWLPMDTGSALNVLEWFKQPLDGVERLFFVSPEGWVNLMEEATSGDQIEADTASGLDWEDITTRVKFRPQGAQLERLQSPCGAHLALETFNPSYSITAHFEGVNKKTVLCENVTKDNTAYTKPWNAAPWDDTNVNDDHATPYREDYRVQIGTNLAAGTYATGHRYPELTTDETYVYVAGNSTSLVVDFTPIPAGTFVAQAGTGDLSGPVGATVTALIYRVGAPPVYFGSGLRMDLMQESLHHFRLSGRQGRSVALEIINTQGRIRWQGILTTSQPGRQRQGVQH